MTESPFDTNSYYFQKLFSTLKNPNQSVVQGKMLANQVSQKMQLKILVSQVTLPQELSTKKLVIPKKVIEPVQQSEQDLLKKVQNQKQSLLSKMKQLSRQQDELKNKIKAGSSKQKNLFKSELTSQDKQRIKQLLKQNKIFEKSINNKNKQLVEFYRERSLQEIKRQEQLNQLKKQRKRQQVIQNLKSLQLKSSQRKQAHEAFTKEFTQIRDKKYLYLKNMEKDEERRIEKQNQIMQKLQQIKSSIKLDIQQIKQHQKKYQQHLQQSQLRLEQKSAQLSKNRRSKSYADSYFSIVTKARIEQQKAEQYQRLNQGHSYKQRICKFQQKLNSEFKPKISNKSKFTPIKQTKSARSLSNVEQREKGMQYLQISKKLKDVEKQKQKRMTVGSPKVKNEYKDYTKQLKYKAYETAQLKFNNLVKYKSSLSNYESASQALQLAAQIQAKSKMLSDKKLLSVVKNKIQLLNALQ